MLLSFITIVFVNILLTDLLLQNLSSFLMSRGIFGIDVNKPEKKKIPEEGGVSIVFSLILSFTLLSYIFKYEAGLLIIVTTLLICLLGFIDYFRNIPPYRKAGYCAGIGSIYSLYFMQNSDLSILSGISIIVIISFGYTVLVNGYNMLAGFNGLESGITVITSLTLSIYFFLKGFYTESSFAFITMTSYLVFWRWNKYPAKIFPGDSGTLVPASIFIGLSISSNTYIPLLFISAPHLLNIIIRFFSTGVCSRSDHKPLVYKDGLLHLPKNSYKSLIRLFILTGAKKEQHIVYFVYAVEILCCLSLFSVR